MLCKKFPQNGDIQNRGKTLIAQVTLCQPKTAGGLNVGDIQIWNKVEILKLLWSLANKKDKLWVIWVHTYYIKENKVQDTQANQVSQVIKKILQGVKCLEESGINVEAVTEINTYSIKHTYNQLREEYYKVPWRKVVCNNHGQSKWTFILFLTLNGKLYTKDMLAKWGIITYTICSLCNSAQESHQHLFFECMKTKEIWQKGARINAYQKRK